jgi:hypothetical protein
LNIGPSDLQDAELVATHASIKNFLLPGLGVEAPSRARAHEGNRQGPLLLSHNQHCLIGPFRLDPMRVLVCGYKTRSSVAICDRIARINQSLTGGPENLQEKLSLIAPRGVDQRIDGVLFALESTLLDRRRRQD